MPTLKNVLTATAEAERIIREFKPDVAVGTGGCACLTPDAEGGLGAGGGCLQLCTSQTPCLGSTTKMLEGSVDAT